MAIYVAIVDEGLEVVKKQLKKHYEDRYYPYHKADNVFFISSDDIVNKVSENLKITDKDRKQEKSVSGVVLKMNSAYTGYTSREFWNWLSEYE